MAKTEHYHLGISSYNTKYTNVPIAKKEYIRLLDEYTKEVKENNKEYSDSEEYYVEISNREIDHGNCIEYISEVVDGATYISLHRVVCKPGYIFKK